MIKVSKWAISPIMLEAGIQGLSISKLNDFPALTQNELEILSQMVVKRIGKIKNKKALKRLLNSMNFTRLVYTELSKLYETR